MFCENYEEFVKTLESHGFHVHTAANGAQAKKTALELAEGAVEIQYDGTVQRFENPEAAAMALPGKYVVRLLNAQNSVLNIAIEKDVMPVNNVNEAWVQDYETETGEEISFF